MSKRDYICPNKCVILPKEIEEKIGMSFSEIAANRKMKYCPNCGKMYPATRKKLNAFFDVYDMPCELSRALDLFFSSEFEASIREAIVTLESLLRKKSKLRNSHGWNLVSDALKYDVDKSGKIITTPLIQINKLDTESERNEHDGFKLMLMGFFKGIRNLYMHREMGAQLIQLCQF